MTNTFVHRPIHGGNLDWASQLVGCLPSDILDFSASINPLGPPQSAIAAITHHFHELQAYPDPSYRVFRNVLAKHHNIDPDWVCPGNGSAELLTWVCRQLAQYSGTAIATPAFSDYGRSLAAFSAKVVDCSMMNGLEGWESARDGEADVGRVDYGHPIHFADGGEDSGGVGDVGRWKKEQLALATLFKDELLGGVLINNPHNPTGYLWQRDEILALVNRAAMVVVDEAFMDFLLPDQQQSVIDAVMDHPNLIVLRSLTKFYSLPGLRIGYAIAHPDHIHQWQQWRDPWPVNALAVAAAIAALADTPFQQQTWNWLQVAKSKLLQGLYHIPGLMPYPGAANYLLVRSTQSTIALQWEVLEADRLLIRDCVSFPELGDRYFRIAIRTVEENQRLLKALSGVMK